MSQRGSRAVFLFVTVLALVAAATLWGYTVARGAWTERGGDPAERVTVTKVIDADTLIVELAGQSERVRLLGVDAPEMGWGDGPGEEFMAREATELTRRLCLGQKVTLEDDPQREDRDSYGRLLRYVQLPDDRSLNAELIRQGYGYAFTRYPFARQSKFVELEREARRRAIGLWAEGGLAELRWNLEHGRVPAKLHPMTNRSWAIEYAGQVKTRVRASGLISELNSLRQSIAEHDETELLQLLREKGYVDKRKARLPGG
jgi:endonuclease YncB( thermonuclease family)